MKKRLSVLIILTCLAIWSAHAQTPHTHGTIIENQTGSWPILYMGQNNAVSHRYLQLINSTTSAAAGGIMAGGILVADSYSYATPDRNDLIVKGKIGVGTSAPAYALDVNGSWAFRSTGYFYDSPAYAYESSTQQYLHFRTTGGKGYVGMESSNDLILQTNGGKVGIGTSNPSYALDVNGSWAFRGTGYFYDSPAYAFESATQQYLHFKTTGGKGYVGMDSSNDLILQTNGGNVGIGKKSPDAKLHVDGKIISEEIVVENVSGADFVFEEGYNLRSLEETERFIKTNKHLPEVPSAETMAKNGLGLKEMNILLLQKIEEMTLHQIDLLKKVEALASEVETLKQN